MGIVAESIKNKLTEALKPSSLEVIDESHKHAGHAGARPEGETHFHVVIVSDAFEGQKRVARHRMVHKILETELADRVHALSLAMKAPSEL